MIAKKLVARLKVNGAGFVELDGQKIAVESLKIDYAAGTLPRVTMVVPVMEEDVEADGPIIVGDSDLGPEPRCIAPENQWINENVRQTDGGCGFQLEPSAAPYRPFTVERLEEMLICPPSVSENYPSYWGLVQQLAETMRENERLRKLAEHNLEKRQESLCKLDAVIDEREALKERLRELGHA